MADYVFYKGRWRGHSQNDTIPLAAKKYLQRREDTDTGIIYYYDGYDWIKSGTPVGLNDLSGPITGKKFGRFDGSASFGASGLLGGGFSAPAAGTANGVLFDTVNGSYSMVTTGAVAGNTTQLRYANPYTCRAFNPTLAIRFMIGTALNNRVHIGFKTSPNTPPADGSNDPLVSISGIMIVQRASGSANTFEIATNNGSANSNFTNTGVTVAASTLYTIKFRAVTDSKFQWSLNGSQWADITAQIPASTTGLGLYMGIQTAEAVAHTLRIYAVETTSDK